MTERTTIGFIGLGAMGGAVARRLAQGPFTVRVYDRDTLAVQRAVEAGAEAAVNAASAASGADVVMTSLPIPEIVEAVWAEMIGRLGEDAIAVDLSTIDPACARRLATVIEASAAAGLVCCTLGRTPAHAEKGEAPGFVGGPPHLVDRLAPILAWMTDSIHDMGSVEGATIFKLISNHIGMTNLAVLAEGYALACRAGIDQDTFTTALKTTGAWSTQADLRLAAVVSGDHTTRFAVDLAQKDLRLATDAAARWHVPTPVGAAALSVFSAASTLGHGGEDASAVIEALDPARTARNAVG